MTPGKPPRIAKTPKVLSLMRDRRNFALALSTPIIIRAVTLKKSIQKSSKEI
jgi:hypothetical protein